MGFPWESEQRIGVTESFVYDLRLIPLIRTGNERYDLVQRHKNCDCALDGEGYDIFRQDPREY